MSEQFAGEYILWIDYCYEGWKPYPHDSIAECYKTAIDFSATDFVITRPPIQVEMTEAGE